MGRTPTDLGPDADARIRARMARGESPKKIHAALQADGLPGVSERTIARRMAALRSEVNAGRSVSKRPVAPPARPKAGPPLPATPEDIPADASLDLLEHYRSIARSSVEAASDEGDLKLVAQLINMAGAVEDRITRRTPRPVEDINDQPDMVRLGAQVEARFLKMIDMVLEDT